MKGSRKDRRSKRVPASHRLLLTIIGPSGSEIAKEIVSTVELSQFGARVRGRRSLRAESEGMLTQLRSGRQARVRVAWQQKSTESAEFFDTGVEILSGFDYWGISFEEPAPGTAKADAPEETVPLTVPELLGKLKESASAEAGGASMEMLWCALVEQMEAKQLFTREELIASLRSVAQLAAPKGAAIDPT